jgi:hypothetical protein
MKREYSKRRLPTALLGPAHRRQGLRPLRYDEPISGHREGRPKPGMPRVAWLERPDVPESPEKPR